MWVGLITVLCHSAATPFLWLVALKVNRSIFLIAIDGTPTVVTGGLFRYLAMRMCLPLALISCNCNAALRGGREGCWGEICMWRRNEAQ